MSETLGLTPEQIEERDRRIAAHEKFDMHEMAAIEQEEWEGSILLTLAGKGYELAEHGTDPCYSCTMSRLVDSLPTADAMRGFLSSAGSSTGTSDE